MLCARLPLIIKLLVSVSFYNQSRYRIAAISKGVYTLPAAKSRFGLKLKR